MCQLHKNLYLRIYLLEHVCVAHYGGKPWYSSSKNINEINKARIRKIEHEAKLKRGCCTQCQTVPDLVSHEHHGIHLNPWNKQFSRILADDSKEELHQWWSSVCLSLLNLQWIQKLQVCSKINTTSAKKEECNRKQCPVSSNYRNWSSCWDFRNEENVSGSIVALFDVLQHFSILGVTRMYTVLPMKHVLMVSD